MKTLFPTFISFTIFLLHINIILNTIVYQDDGSGYPRFILIIEETFNKTGLVKDTEKVEFNDKKTSDDIINEMGFGWNLGNTLDAHKAGVFNQGLDSEVSWGNPYTTEEIIKGLSDKGVKTIRIPVTWHNHLIDDYYTIDPEWMERVKTIVDWSIKHKLYVILNTHHDYYNLTKDSMPYGKGFYTLKKDKVESEKFLYNIWKQITEAFNNGYDHHLIFEPLNEPHLEGSDYSWKYVKGNSLCEEAVSTLNEYMQLIVRTIRESGGNNEKRFLLICPLMASVSTALNSDFIFPSDNKYNPNNNKMILSVHSYSPSDFAGSKNPNITIYKEEYNINQYEMYLNLYEKFVLNGYNVIFGEFGSTNKNNTEERIKWGKYYIETAKKHHMSCIIWDNGKMDNVDDIKSVYGIYDRREIEWIDDDLIDSYVKSGSVPMEENPGIQYYGLMLDESFHFNEWKNKLKLEGYIFRLYNSFCKLYLNLSEPEEKPKYRALTYSNGDWTERFIFNNSELKNAIFKEDDNSTRPPEGNVLLEIHLNPYNSEMAQNKGMIIFGHGLVAEEVYISGPRFVKMEPLKITSSEKSQKLSIYFTEDATDLTNNIIFENNHYNLNDQISCEVDSENEKVVICEGIFNFTGDYIIKDSNDYLLTKRKLIIIPKEGEKDTINNLIDTKINFDDENYRISIQFSKNKFSEVNKNTVLNIETSDLFIEPKSRILYIFQGKGDSTIKFESDQINMNVQEDNGIEIPSGSQVISIDLKDKYKILKEAGITIKGYGFSLNSIYFNDQLNENDENNDDDKDKDKDKDKKDDNHNDDKKDGKNEDKNGKGKAKPNKKAFIIMLIIMSILCALLIVAVLIFKKSPTKIQVDKEDKEDEEDEKNEKILNEA